MISHLSFLSPSTHSHISVTHYSHYSLDIATATIVIVIDNDNDNRNDDIDTKSDRALLMTTFKY